MELKEQLEQLRSVLFTGKTRNPSSSPLTQPEYVAIFEGRLERDPEQEWRALRSYARPILPLVRGKLEERNRLESFVNDKQPAPIPGDERFLLTALYEDMMELETEEEWRAWVKQWE